jgi:NAD(P)H dehydrogenase (quinone)
MQKAVLEVSMATLDHRPKILVTGATGKTGRAVVAQLLEDGYLVRSRDARSQRLERLGAETIVANLFDFEQMLEAVRGRVRAYYCPPRPHPEESVYGQYQDE